MGCWNARGVREREGLEKGEDREGQPDGLTGTHVDVLPFLNPGLRTLVAVVVSKGQKSRQWTGYRRRSHTHAKYNT